MTTTEDDRQLFTAVVTYFLTRLEELNTDKELKNYDSPFQASLDHMRQKANGSVNYLRNAKGNLEFGYYKELVHDALLCYLNDLETSKIVLKSRLFGDLSPESRFNLDSIDAQLRQVQALKSKYFD